MIFSFKKITASLHALTFHGLVESYPKYSVCPSTRGCHIYVTDFIKILEICSKHYYFARLADIESYLEGAGKRPAVLLTFDDGLNSVTDLAVPILRKFSASALVFVNTSWVDSGQSPAIFDLERQLWEIVPVRVGIEVLGFRYEITISDRSFISAAVDNIWRFLLSNKVAPLNLKKNNFYFNEKIWSNNLHSGYDVLWAPATWEKLRTCVSDGTCEIGSHGESHIPWPWLNKMELKKELHGSKCRLQNELEIDVTSCSYPHGLSNVDTELTVSASYYAGFGTSAGLINSSSYRANLPRFHVPSVRPNGLPWIVDHRRAGRLLRKGKSILDSIFELRL